jgi:hypothetical protein
MWLSLAVYSVYVHLQGVSDQISGQKAHELTTKNVCSLIRVELPTVTGARNSFGVCNFRCSLKELEGELFAVVFPMMCNVLISKCSQRI